MCITFIICERKKGKDMERREDKKVIKREGEGRKEKKERRRKKEREEGKKEGRKRERIIKRQGKKKIDLRIVIPRGKDKYHRLYS